MSANLIGKTILITGASSGIGAATAWEFALAANGKIRLILGARRLDKLVLLSKEISTKYPLVKIFVSELDVGCLEKVDAFFDSIPDEFSKVDILVNNAGKALGQDHVGSIFTGDVEAVYAANVVGLIAVTQKVMAGMKVRNSGDIVQIGSIAGRDTYPGGSIYCSSKAAVRSFTDSLRKELISTKLRVIEIVPGNTQTEFALVRFKGDSSKANKVYEGMEALQAQDIADLIIFICSRRQNTVISEAVIMATNQAGPNHLFRS